MKFLYFITALRGLNLGYRFTLYSYGPFDSAVLEDSDYAATLNAVRVRTEIYRSGYGYVIEQAPRRVGQLALRLTLSQPTTWTSIGYWINLATSAQPSLS